MVIAAVILPITTQKTLPQIDHISVCTMILASNTSCMAKMKKNNVDKRKLCNNATKHQVCEIISSIIVLSLLFICSFLSHYKLGILHCLAQLHK